MLAEKSEVTHDSTPLPAEERDLILRRVRITCDLFNLAFELKSLSLKRRFPEASESWIANETFRLIEAGTR